MCGQDNGSLGILGIAFAIAAYNIAKLYFEYKKPVKTGFEQELFDRFGLTPDSLDVLLIKNGK